MTVAAGVRAAASEVHLFTPGWHRDGGPMGVWVTDRMKAPDASKTASRVPFHAASGLLPVPRFMRQATG